MNLFNEINDYEYKYIVKDIINNETVKSLDNIPHHGVSRLEHSLKVSYYAYKLSKILKLDYKKVARAGLLHDLYFDRTKEKEKIKDKIKLFSIGHPSDAVKNACELFDLSDKEIDIIRSHMFPIDYKIPKYSESWLVSIVDKIISFNEFSYKFKYQMYASINVWMIFLINLKK